MRNPLRGLGSIVLAVSQALWLSSCGGPAEQDGPGGAAQQTASRSSASCCDVVPSRDIGEGMGRIAVHFPGDGASLSTRIDVYAAGDSANSFGGGWGDETIELRPGEYDVVVGGKRVSGVAVEPGRETRVRVGVVHVFAGSSTRVDFLDAESAAALAGGFGDQRYGFPVGIVTVRVAGQTDSVLVEDGRVTEF